MPTGWINNSPSGNSTVCFCHISHQGSDSCSAFVECSLLIRSDLTWHVHVHNHLLPPSSHILKDFRSHLDSTTASMVLAKLSELHTCPGNPEPKFTALANGKRNMDFRSSNDEVVAFVDTNGMTNVKGTWYPSTVRTTKCQLLTGDLRCTECKGYRKNLLAQHSRAKQQQPERATKKVNYR